MTHGFQQQDRSGSSSFTKSAPTQQNGQKPDPRASTPVRRSRTFEPRPGH
jgi:hypothetical protein